jgi:hypothetical protein
MVRFYSPHPGLAGAAIRLPKLLKDVADSLDGIDGTVEDVVRLFEKAGKILVKNKSFGKVAVKVVDKSIDEPFIMATLYEGDGNEKKYPCHSFKVISYEEEVAE